MSLSAFSDLLSALEAELESIAQALGSSDSSDIERGAQSLRDATARLAAGPLPPAATLPPELKQRLSAVSARLALLRETLLRLQAQTERAVATLLPQAAPGATYGASFGRAGTGLSKAYKP
ncbi:hypothetical protein PSQ40_16245 [Curvibacter sp. HBC61]|uniref:Flagellar protein FlgN n=1 Tax=Curvibacter cyanobacteriorum TaxID=3026422 RepID=A0ABT5N211_9BURK|nr:hypothetical protein [Curvibacter sp. HBC61]MDD0840137.1 hypothetical protein [Curvibacter sp. HBC61]